MRKNPKPLNIGVIEIPLDNPALVELVQKGHTVYELGGPQERVLGCGDVVIGPLCWRIDPLLGYLDTQLTMMIEGVRNVKYPKEKEGEHAK